MNQPKMILGIDPISRRNQLSALVEELYNHNHGKGGLFTGPGGISDKLHDVKSKITKVNPAEAKDEAKRFAELFIGLPGQSSLRPKAFSKTDLKTFSTPELNRFKEQFQTDAKNLRTAKNTAYLGVLAIPLNTNRIPIAAISVTRSSIVVGISTWRIKKINQQVTRINKALAARKSKRHSLAFEEFQIEDLEPSLMDEIRRAKAQIESGKIPTVEHPSAADIREAREYVNSLKVDPSEGITESFLKALKDTMG